MTDKKSSNGLGIYLSEEIGDARLRAAQLKGRIDEALGMIQQSPKKDHFFEVAGHLIQEVPDLMLKLDKALAASAMAIAKWQGDELEDQLSPEKVKELDDALADTRVKKVIKSAKENPVKPSQVIEQLRKLASSPDGSVDINALVDLIRGLGSDVRVASKDLEGLADTLADTKKPSRALVASSLKTILTASVKKAYSTSEDYYEAVRQNAHTALNAYNAGVSKRAISALMEMITSLSFIMEQYGAVDAARLIIKISTKCNRLRMDPNLDLSSNDVAVEVFPNFLTQIVAAKRYAAGGHEKMAMYQLQGIVTGLGYLMDSLGQEDASTYCAKLNLEMAQVRRTLKASDEKLSRFEEGKPADPTSEMSKEDAKKWWAEHEKNKDNFKEATKEEKSAEEESDVEAWTKAKSLVPKTNKHKKYARFEEGEKVDPTKDMSKEDAEKWKANTDKYEDKFKDEADKKSASEKLASKSTGLLNRVKKEVEEDDWVGEVDVDETYSTLQLKAGDEHDAPTITVIAHDEDNVVSVRMGPKVEEVSASQSAVVRAVNKFKKTVKTASSEEKRSKFEEGKPADPTENMSEEDAKKWKIEHEKNKDNFKEAFEECRKFLGKVDGWPVVCNKRKGHSGDHDHIEKTASDPWKAV